MSEFNVQPDKVFRVTGAGKEMDISNGTFDHAVRYPQAYNWLDHLVICQPVGIPFEDEDTGEDGIMSLIDARRYFLGALAIETIVEAIGLHEIYANEVTKSVHEEYLVWQENTALNELDFDIE